MYGHSRLNTRPVPEGDRTGAGFAREEQSGNEAVEKVYPMLIGTRSLWCRLDMAAYRSFCRKSLVLRYRRCRTEERNGLRLIVLASSLKIE